MLRADNVSAGTTTTGTGNLTFAPVSIGAIDFYQWLTASGANFASGAALLVSYTIIEYTTSLFTTPKQIEKGIGAVTLGASLSATTLTRTQPQQTWTGSGSPSFGANAAAINIGVAANTLIFVSPSANETMAFEPGYSSIGDNLGVAPAQADFYTSGFALTSGTDYFSSFIWTVPILAKRISLNVNGNYSGGTPVSNLYARLYALGLNGQPGKLLYDFGLVGTSNTSLNSAGNISSGASGPGFMMLPGEYFIDVLPIFSGGTSTPYLTGYGGSLLSGRMGASSMIPYVMHTATSGTSTAPDTANSTGYAGSTTALIPAFVIKDS